MVNINLLPWRAQLEKEKQKEFIILLLFVVGISIFICFILHVFFKERLSRQLKINTYLSEQITLVDQQIIDITALKQQKNDLLRRLAIIHTLQASRVLLVEMFDNFVNVLPNGIYITSIKKDYNIITITGKARSNQEVSQLMKNIDASSSFTNPVLTEIQDNSDNTQSQTPLEALYSQSFELQMKEKVSARLMAAPEGKKSSSPPVPSVPQSTTVTSQGSES